MSGRCGASRTGGASPTATPSGSAGGSLTGTYPSPTIAAGAVTGSAIAANIKDPAAATAGLRTLGTGAAQAAPGDALSNAVLLLGATGGTIGVYGTGGVVRPDAYTQTYATASRTHDNPTASAVATTAATQVTPYGYSQAQANAIVAALNALIVDVANVKQVLNSVIDDDQAQGWKQ